MRDNKVRWLSIVVMTMSLGLASCSRDTGQENMGDTVMTEEIAERVEKEKLPEMNKVPLRDKKLLYASDDEGSVVTMYLTVRRGNKAEGSNHSWEEINTYSTYDYDKMGVDRYRVEALLQVGDENGPLMGELGYQAIGPNATVQVRGQTSSRNAQKNYKVHLKDNKGIWRGQQTIALNKHQSDGMRFRNKLGFDLLKELPQTMSLRTQFVHLYVKDETGGSSGGFVDYGLYTQVEQLNKKALRTHGLDSKGHLYKINFCEFYRSQDVIKLIDDPSFNEKAFDKLLESKGDSNHTKLIQMLDAVNDYSISSSELIDNYFNMENMTYWMAFHILTGNVDTQNRNFYIYSPQNLNNWYLMSWDNDTMFRGMENQIRGRSDAQGWEKGVSNYWGNVLFQRCLKSEDFRKQLDAAILDVKSYLSEERISDWIDIYSPITKKYTYSMPDVQHESLTPENYTQVAEAIPGEVEDNYQLYLESLQNPLPFFIGVPEIKDNKLVVQWDTSYDFQSEDISYKAEVARDYKMQDIVAEYEGIWPTMELDMLPVGQYFIRVKASDISGHEQYAFDYYVVENGKVYGIKCFYVLPDGSIGEDVYEE
ncbi:MAG: CotH kinase family protein [Clostridium sp.]